ncbi:hypothetical protein [Bradyrhizobium erythrophlei]|uniref:hypothetical protein n=1 Tax=Bradyrhizobium erythrophlei TaxID=1437360 RepID=UPI000B890042|nr:hypothetical protein [Bradyrhizobium erythrophlei]
MDEELNNGGRERLLHDLLTFDVSQGDLWRLPQTNALLEQKIRSLDTINDFWFNRLHESDEWPSLIRCDDLHAEYIKFATQTGVGRKRGAAEFGKRLGNLVPGLRNPRPSLEVSSGAIKRTWCYEFPMQYQCRLAFDEPLGQRVDWPALPSGESERRRCRTSMMLRLSRDV